jgi:hypothetical protein
MQTFETLKIQEQRYGEDYCCTVIATAAALNISYGKAHRAFAKAGRKPRCGASMRQIHSVLTGLGAVTGNAADSYRAEGVGLTLKRFTREYPSGTYYVCTRDHAVCIRDGEMIDWTANTAGRRKIENVWKIA